MPEGAFMLMFGLLPSSKKEDVYTSMESLIYHFKIVMGEVPVPVAEIYHPVEGGTENGFYLVTGSNSLSCISVDLVYYQAYPEMIKGALSRMLCM
jgi:NADH-quinone oxidoreductase subunit D